MKKKSTERYKDVDIYVREIEEVYDLSLEFDFTPLVRVGVPSSLMIIKAYDRDDNSRETGPLLYHQCEVPSSNTYKRSQAIIRGLTDITYQALELYITRKD